MRVRLDGYARAHVSLRRRAIALVAAGIVALAVAAFFGLAMIVAVLSTPAEIGAQASDRWMLIVLFGGVTAVTAIPGGLMVWRGLAGIGRMQRLRELSVLARRQLVSSSAEVAKSLRLRPAEAEGLMRDAAALGVVDGSVDALAATMPAAQGDAGAPAGSVLNGTYRLEAHLGAGAMGTVHVARHLRTGRAYAVKTIRPDARAGADSIRRFQREATAAGSLGHPNIVAVHDLDVTPEGVHYLVMDLLRGETLEQRLAREGSLPFEDARRIALDLAAALEAAHAQGLLHRDVKPANVFLAQAPPRAVLLDFGLVKRLDEAAATKLTSTGATVGTPLYMSPEQARGEPLDVRSDVYSLAAVLYEMLTGAPPFIDHTLAGVYARLLTESAPRVSALRPVPPSVDALLDRGLAKQREARFADVRSFAEALARAQ